MTTKEEIARKIRDLGTGYSRVGRDMIGAGNELSGLADRVLAELEDAPADPPDNGDDTTPPVQPGYPDPHGLNVVEPGDLTLGDDGSLSTRHEFPVTAARRRGWGGIPEAATALTFNGHDFPRFYVHNCKPGSRIDMLNCTFRDQTRNGLDIDFYGDTASGFDRDTHRPGGLALRLWDPKFLRNYHPDPDHLNDHSVGAFIRARGVDDVLVGMFNVLARYQGSGPDRDATAGSTDHWLYLQGRGHEFYLNGGCLLDGANLAIKGGWEVVTIRNTLIANYGCGGFFGPDKSETDKFGEFTTTGVMEDCIIYGMTDIPAKNMPQSWGWILNGGCDAVFRNVHIVNPNKLDLADPVDPNRPLHAFHCVDQGGRPIKARFENVHLYGYDVAVGGKYGDMTNETWASVDFGITYHDRLPDLNLNRLRQLVDSGGIRPDATVAWAKRELGVA